MSVLYRMTPRRLLEELDSAELAELQAAERLNLLPDSHWQTGLICATVANSAGAKPARSPDDFIPKPPRPVEVQTAHDAMGIVRGLQKAINDRAARPG